MTLAQVGATDKGGVCRLALTDLDRQGASCRALARETDAASASNASAHLRPSRGQPVAARSPRQPHRPSPRRQVRRQLRRAGGAEVAHAERSPPADEAPRGMRLDQRGGLALRAVMMGSGVWAARFRSSTRSPPATATGSASAKRLDRPLFRHRPRRGGRRRAGLRRYFEAHIEQGPVLEDAG